MELPRAFGPKTTIDHDAGRLCPACKEPFKIGDYTTLIGLGPGNDSEEQEKARLGKPYNAIALELHYACVTGYQQPPN